VIHGRQPADGVRCIVFRVESSGIPGDRPPPSADRGRYRSVMLATVVVCAGLLAVLLSTRQTGSVDALVRDGLAALARGQPSVALEYGKRAASRAPRSVAAWRLLADAAEQSEDRSQAVAALTRLAEIDLPNAGTHWMRIGGLEMKRYRIHEAGQALRRSLEFNPGQVGALRLRAQLTGVLGHSQELTDCLMQLIQHEAFRLDDLVVLAGYDPYISDPAGVESIRRESTDDCLALLALAREALNAQRTAEAERDLRKLVACEPALWEAQALLGEIYVERPGGEFLDWHAALSADADSCSRIWLTRGLWLRGRGELDRACRCFWEAVRREPEVLKSTMQLGQTLSLCGETGLGQQVLLRAKRMQQIVNVADQIGERQRWSRASALIDDLEATGRLWEAWAWCTVAAQAVPHEPAFAARRSALSRRLAPGLPRTLPEAVPGRDFDWSRFALPDWSAYGPEPVALNPVEAPSRIRFVDQARELGLTFEYTSSNAPGGLGHHIFETTGGGVAALDFDGDGWIDLYFAQGGSWPVIAGAGPHDALFRNQGGVRFDDVTVLSGIVEDSYSQGVAAGDFDNDGFADLYVANIGRNRLFHNNGDGTFTDVTDSAGLKDEAWTSSCAIADLNGDGFPDLFDVNYVEGQEVFTVACVGPRGEPLVCRPTVFEPALDRVALSLGDGRFVEMGDEAGLNLPYGRGLGLIVADFNEDRKLDVFVANDQGANYLLINQQSGAGGSLRFSDRAHRVGVALDRDGLSKAGMGIAAGDVNGDGRLDLFVTTFARENKVLYLSQPDGLYVDGTFEAGLRSPTYEFLGFGTQFLDADLDGRLDLLILNGHIDEFEHEGMGYRMRPQLFHGRPGSRFVELSADEAGSFFGVKRLGRGLATLDWNRDGLLDFVATYLEGSAALGTNQTRAAGHALRLKLVGASSSRDAIGARLRIVLAEGKETHVQLTAGDGYESCNERLVHVGVGSRDKVERLEIEWPSGMMSVFEDVTCQETWLAIEGASRLRMLRRDPL
jgi:tetratricopeptide (TPR) repeat protein